MTGILYHDIFLKHNTGIGHPERPARVSVIVEALGKDRYAGLLQWVEPRSATVEELAYVHDTGYIERVRETCAQGPQYLDSPDTPVSQESFEAALYAAGAVITAVDDVLAGKYTSAFCPVRPPGHHARYSTAMGFCLFNNIAVAARHLKHAHNIRKILIVDFDVHHCNGTEEMLAGDNDILLCSMHQHPHYPGTGFTSRLNSHSGGILNSPMPPGATDEDYLRVVKGRIADEVNKFMPDFVLVSAGFDAHIDDPLSGINLSTEAYYTITKEIVAFANSHCGGRVVSTLEGGYNLNALSEAAARHVDALIEATG